MLYIVTLEENEAHWAQSSHSKFTRLCDFLWQIQSRLANQRSITSLRVGSLTDFNLRNGQMLRMLGLEHAPFHPQSRLDRFMDLKRTRGVEFIYFIIHSPLCCAWQRPNCLSVAIIRGSLLPFQITLSAENPICLRNGKTVFICRYRPLNVTLLH